MTKLSFKQYLESKEQLRNAIANTPMTVLEYDVRKYCSLTVGETDDDKLIVGLKPTHKIIIEWQYDNITAPTPTSISFVGPGDIIEDDKYVTSWSGTKLQKWLSRHTKEGQVYVNKI